MELVIKTIDEKSVNGTQIFHWEVSTGKTVLPFQMLYLFPEIFQWNEPKSRVPFPSQQEFPENFGKWKTTLEYQNEDFTQLGKGRASCN